MEIPVQLSQILKRTDAKPGSLVERYQRRAIEYQVDEWLEVSGAYTMDRTSPLILPNGSQVESITALQTHFLQIALGGEGTPKDFFARTGSKYDPVAGDFAFDVAVYVAALHWEYLAAGRPDELIEEHGDRRVWEWRLQENAKRRAASREPVVVVPTVDDISEGEAAVKNLLGTEIDDITRARKGRIIPEYRKAAIELYRTLMGVVDIRQ